MLCKTLIWDFDGLANIILCKFRILIPVENFVSTKNKVPYDSEKVWLDNEKGFYDRVKGTRIIKEYAS